MNTRLIIGVTSMALIGTSLLGTALYASSQYSSTHRDMPNHTLSGTGNMKALHDPSKLIASLSGKLSPAAQNALVALVNKHKAAMDTLQSGSGNTDTGAYQNMRTLMRSEMDALMTQYPEIGTAFKNMAPTRPNKKRGGRDMRMHEDLGKIFSALSVADKEAIETIRTEYRSKIDALHTEERAKMAPIIAKYPAIQQALNAQMKMHGSGAVAPKN